MLGEGRTVSYLKQAAKRLGRSIRVYSKINDLVTSLKEDGL